ncbi:MAG: hypothetical protein VR65_06225 [Desulfobulbaceae bacterium BRH_c16a]|nr:MAG: hypothetical protein VR65_06225 [Desulfobulbaceae bacterium BRH_c16a]
MLNELHDLIAARLATVAGFEYIGTALQDEQQKRPDGLIWLEDDSEVANSPGRDLTWGVRVSVNHSDTVGAAKTTIYNLLDAFRDAFARWEPGVKGIEPKSVRVPKIKLAGHESKGPTIYTALVVFRVFPKIFAQS